MKVALRVRQRPKIFYGWYIIGTAMAAGFVGAGVSQQFMGIMLKPMTEDFGWSRTAISGAMTVGTLTAGLTSPLFGRLTDRYGPRVIATLGALAVGGIFFALAGLAAIWQFYLGVSLDELRSKRRQKGLVEARQVAMYLLHQNSQENLSNIGRLLGQRDHSTVIHGIRSIERTLPSDEELQRHLDSIKDSLRSTA